MLKIYGAGWCKDCIKIKEFLDEKGFTYDFLDITDPEKGEDYSRLVMDINNGKRIIPTLEIAGEYYANPRLSDLTNILDNLDEANDVTRCSNGKELFNGDSVLLTRDLDVKGSSLNLKQGTALEKIKLTGDPAYIDCKIGKATLVIKTMYVKKKG